ncbi:hypothetical protein [Streptomyces sp. 2132.2]|uniref:hypothetical protein n=1 Tax=Streptomyces sp. 2132.2 TaxID=2485161 RepID=UPI000C195BC4|nr:hypothetical protein [Streptomyces sp. 2132.2]
MLIMDAVLETYKAADFTGWPIAEPPADRLVPLSGRLSSREVGTAMAILAEYNGGSRRGARASEAGIDQVRRLVDGETVVAPGGLRIRDTVTGVTALPGCCFGLENWRDWGALAGGEWPWLGHDPTPRVEHVGAVIRLWPDTDRQDGPPIDIPRAQMPELLGSVQEELVAFLSAAGRWAGHWFPAVSASLVDKLDEGLAISAPLPDGHS